MVASFTSHRFLLWCLKIPQEFQLSDCLIFRVHFLVSKNASAYVYCQTEVSEIQPHISNGIVYFKFKDGTAIEGNETQSGLQRNMAVALAALASKKQVKVALNDGEQCGSNRYDRWTYIIAIEN